MLSLRSWCVLVLVVAPLLAPADSARAEPFHSAEFGFRIHIPDGWVQIPDDVLEGTMYEAKVAKGLRVAAFQPVSPEWFYPAFVIILADTYQQLGFREQPYEVDLLANVDRLLPTDTDGDIRLQTKPSEPGEIDYHSFSYDPQRQQVTYREDRYVTPKVNAHILAVGHFGSDHFVLTSYNGLEDWMDYHKDAELLMQSFRFDPDRSFMLDPEGGPRRNAERVKRQAPIVVMVLIVLIALARQQRAKRRAAEREALARRFD